jgi:molybdopterin-binding protein
MALRVENISKALASFALNDVSFNVEQDRYFVLLGASGTGKSLLLEIIAGLMRPDAGQIFLDGKEITNEKIQDRRVGLVFQDNNLFGHMNVYDNIAYPLRCRRFARPQIKKRVFEVAEDFGVLDLLKRNPWTLSGGESQLVSLARAVAGKPRCLLLDEPLSSVDTSSRSKVRSVLRKIHCQDHVIVHVTHDYTEAISLCTHIAVLENGMVAQTGRIEEIFQNPRSEFVARFIGIKNFFKGRLEDRGIGQTSLKSFATNGLRFSVLTDAHSGNGYIIVRSESVTISNVTEQTSNRNNFMGTIADIMRAGIGIEVIVDIGVEIAAMITSESAEELNLHRGKKVWISFKASDIEYIEE